jgi:MHS family proline/betaine transporter-like MFS transporter
MRHNLSSEHKEAIVLMSIGTFLEYFDLMLFVHMAVLLNDLFFPKADPFVASIIGAFTFCSTWIFKPFGALLFGYIGDRIGRKHTVIITTMMMGISCIIMANVGTYAQIGIMASWVMIICRALQGMSSIGESIGAELYILETVRKPYQYVAVGLIGLAGVVGMVVSLIVAKLVLSVCIDWRIIFYVGTVVAGIGLVARRKLREAPEYSDAKRKYEKMLKKLKIAEKNLKNIYIIKLFDRVHNMQTINFKSIEKQGKIAIETLNHIFPLAIYLEIPKIEQLLKDICSQILSTPIFQPAYSEEELKKKALRTA